MKKILFAIKNMNIGGVETSLLSLLNTIDKNEYDVDLLLLEKKGDFLESIPDGIKVIIYNEYSEIKDEVNLPPVFIIKRYVKQGNIARAMKLARGYLITKLKNDYNYYYKAVFNKLEVLEKQYDIAVSYSSIIGYLTWIVNNHIQADKRIGWIHFDISKLWIDHKFLIALHKNMDKIYIVSKEALTSFTKEFPELKSKCELRYNIIDRNAILHNALEVVDSIRAQGMMTIITLGRLSPEKGQDIIPEIAAKLKADGYNFKWYLIGDGILRHEIEKLINRFRVQDNIIMLGTKENPYPYLKQADLYVQTSLHEGYCITLAEAKVFGMPIVSTNFAGAHEQLDDRANCRVVDRDSNQIVRAIEQLI